MVRKGIGFLKRGKVMVLEVGKVKYDKSKIGVRLPLRSRQARTRKVHRVTGHRQGTTSAPEQGARKLSKVIDK